MSRAQKLIPVPGTGKAAWMLSISLCKQMINTLHGIRKCGSDVGGASTAKRPHFSHGCVSETQSRSASHFCVYGTSKLRYQVRPQTANCHGRPSRSGPVGSGETRSVAAFLARHSDSQSRRLWENKQPASEQSPTFPWIESRGNGGWSPADKHCSIPLCVCVCESEFTQANNTRPYVSSRLYNRCC